MTARLLTVPVRFAGVPIALQRPGLGGPLPLAWQRRYLDAVARTLAQPAGITISWTLLGGRRAMVLTPAEAEPGRAILYLHGGSYTVGSATSHRSLGAFLAAASAATVYLPEYRLAPEHPYPAALDDAIEAYRDLTDRVGGAPAHLVVGGDSAGGGLATAMARRVIDEGLGSPAALVLIAPWLDPAQRSPKRRDRVVRDRWGIGSAAAYADRTALTDPGVAPLRGRLTGLPPTLIHVGTEELLLPQAREFAILARAAGVDVTLREFDWMWHVAHAQSGLFAPARAAVDDLGAFVREHTAGDEPGRR